MTASPQGDLALGRFQKAALVRAAGRCEETGSELAGGSEEKGCMHISMKTLEAKSIVKGRDLQARAPSEYTPGACRTSTVDGTMVQEQISLVSTDRMGSTNSI